MSEADDEQQRERQVILQRRAQLVAYAVAAGVATAACSGKTSSVCLEIPVTSGTGGTAVTTGGTSYCLSIAEGGMPGEPAAGASAGGEAAGGEAGATGEGGTTAGSGGAGGTPMICLTPPA
jgi:hypothetical protein